MGLNYLDIWGFLMKKVTIDKQKAIALNKTAFKTIERINETDIEKYAANVLKDYYDAIHELLESITCLDGIKISGKGAHEKLINYISKTYKLDESNKIFLQELRNYRNRISYEGLSIESDYIIRNKNKINFIIESLKKIINTKLSL